MEPLLQQLVNVFPEDKEVKEFVQKVDSVYPRKVINFIYYRN